MNAQAIAATVRSAPPQVEFDPARARRWTAPATWCALAVLAAGLLVPTCCLNGTHAHGGSLDGFGPICFARI